MLREYSCFGVWRGLSIWRHCGLYVRWGISGGLGILKHSWRICDWSLGSFPVVSGGDKEESRRLGTRIWGFCWSSRAVTIGTSQHPARGSLLGGGIACWDFHLCGQGDEETSGEVFSSHHEGEDTADRRDCRGTGIIRFCPGNDGWTNSVKVPTCSRRKSFR